MVFTEFSVDNCVGLIQRTTMSDIVVEGMFKKPMQNKRISYIAASPPDLRASYTGSALPFTSPDMALQGTPNRGTVQLDSANAFKITLLMPNSYYAGHGTVLVPPTLYLVCDDDVTIPIKLEDSIPFRTLTYPQARTSAMFYNTTLPVRSQEQILRDSAYPQDSFKTPNNFWALKPPC